MSCLHVLNLRVTFHTPMGKAMAVDGVSFDHLGGETLALLGESGCGKSVIAGSILRILPDNAEVSGSIRFLDRELLELSERELAAIRGDQIGIVLQNPSLALNPVHPIGKQIAEPLLIHRGLSPGRALQEAEKRLLRFGFRKEENVTKMYPFQLSGGMSQRVLIAASMALEPRVLIADEPTKGLDFRVRQLVIEELQAVKKGKASSLLLITHDVGLARNISDRTAIMYAGEIVETGPTELFFEGPLHPYSQALLESLPERGFHPIPGASPSLTDPPTGCKFHPRCVQRRDACSRERPPDVHLGGRRVKCVLYA